MTELEQLKKENAELKKRIGIGEHDPAKDGYLVLVNILNQQNEYLKQFNIKAKISSDEKADMTEYKNAKDLWENLPNMIEKVTNLKHALKMEGENKKDFIKPISAKEIANGYVQ